MESIKYCPLLTHHGDTLEAVRKLFDLDSPIRIEESLNILTEWAKKQVHFNKKDFSRDLLEKMLIKAKGSVEKSKERLEAVCTFKTIFPHIYRRKVKVAEIPGLENVLESILPKLTTDHHRVYMVKVVEKNFNETFISNFFIREMAILDYIMHFDYSAGIILIIDYMDTDLSSILSALTHTSTRQFLLILFKVYAMRLKGLHIMTKSKLVEVLVSTLKHILGKNIERFHAHKTLESLHEEVEKEVLPADYGGNQELLDAMSKNSMQVISSDEALQILEEINEATVDLTLKPVQKEYDEYLGISGSFRSISID